MKVFILVLFLGIITSANELNVKFGVGPKGTSKTFKIDDESPGFMSKGGKILCAVTYDKKPGKFNIDCKSGGMTITIPVECNGQPRTTIFKLDEEKDPFFVGGICMGPDKT